MAVNFSNPKYGIHIIIWYWDDILGQQTIITVPELPKTKEKKITTTLSRLVDIHYDIPEWQFSYFDPIFSSQIIKYKEKNVQSRAGMIDITISLLITPTDDDTMVKMLELWNFIPVVKEICEPFLVEFNKKDMSTVQSYIKSELVDIINEINHLFA